MVFENRPEWKRVWETVQIALSVGSVVSVGNVFEQVSYLPKRDLMRYPRFRFVAVQVLDRMYYDSRFNDENARSQAEQMARHLQDVYEDLDDENHWVDHIHDDLMYNFLVNFQEQRFDYMSTMPTQEYDNITVFTQSSSENDDMSIISNGNSKNDDGKSDEEYVSDNVSDNGSDCRSEEEYISSEE